MRMTSSASNTGALRQRLFSSVRSNLGGRKGLFVIGAGALALGIAFNWNWLAAAGLLPLLSVLPCLGMCVFAICMNKGAAVSSNLRDTSDQAMLDPISNGVPALQLVKMPDGSWDVPMPVGRPLPSNSNKRCCDNS